MFCLFFFPKSESSCPRFGFLYLHNISMQSGSTARETRWHALNPELYLEGTEPAQSNRAIPEGIECKFDGLNKARCLTKLF